MSEKKINGAKSEAEWWKWFRRTLEEHFAITEMTEEQWQLANALAAEMKVKPITAAIKVAKLVGYVEFYRTENGFGTVFEPRIAMP